MSDWNCSNVRQHLPRESERRTEILEAKLKRPTWLNIKWDWRNRTNRFFQVRSVSGVPDKSEIRTNRERPKLRPELQGHCRERTAIKIKRKFGFKIIILELKKFQNFYNFFLLLRSQSADQIIRTHAMVSIIWKTTILKSLSHIWRITAHATVARLEFSTIWFDPNGWCMKKGVHNGRFERTTSWLWVFCFKH